MIKSKADYKKYIAEDKRALGISRNRPKAVIDSIWKFQILLRKCEYYINCRNDFAGKIIAKLYKLRYTLLARKLGFSVPFNAFGYGLSIAHYGMLTVNQNAKIGNYCRVHEGVTIGATGGSPDSATIGDRVFIGSGAKIIGKVKIADGVAIGAGAVVVKDILEPNTTWGGVPAKKISDNGSEKCILCK